MKTKNELLQEIAKDVIDGTGGTKGYNSYDTWGSKDRTEKYTLLLNMLNNDVNSENAFKVDGNIFSLFMYWGNSHSPSSIHVKLLNIYEL